MSILTVTIALLHDTLATLSSVLTLPTYCSAEEGAAEVSLPRALLLHPKGDQVYSDSSRYALVLGPVLGTHRFLVPHMTIPLLLTGAVPLGSCLQAIDFAVVVVWFAGWV